ncbi:sugar transferase [Tepidibacillus fermentans]|uniref:Exopolysaccharide biosynthesis polyprenyl glycosylphosphotransferase n=1 Tax=Tepidibacillus fermentans TaxID=1281767 RepID=A0A4R3KIH4_9BACI|nr:sugar transferase [Tepidibacillus fermentans]TCS83370.1 exopolysaccharide biosynthesis polyprenyl glycosylphosphotransferase [Tepidibacillus fermentans]
MSKVSYETRATTVSQINTNYSFYIYVKRTFDIIVSLLLILLFLPIFLIVAVLIRLESKGPVFFLQERVGQFGNTFKIIKFRSMLVNAEEILPTLKEFQERKEVYVKMKNDPRVTKIGSIIRKLSLDELPQLINVLKGDMSLVGPRPLIQSEIEHCTKEQLVRLNVKPGITGLAQISGRTDVTFDQLLTHDINYVKNQSLKLDLIILLKTIPYVILGKGAY